MSEVVKENNKFIKRIDERIRKCPECGSKNLITDYPRAEIYCADCGVVIAENIIDSGPEWRVFDPEEFLRKTRTGPGMTYRIHDKGLSTPVTWHSIGQAHFKLKKWQQNITTQRTLIFALNEIDRMACELKLTTDMKEAASMLYRKVQKKHLLRGRNIESLVAATLYIICRQFGVPRTLEEVRDVSRVGQKEISRSYRFLLRELDLKVQLSFPIDFVPRFCSRLNLSAEVRLKAIEIIKDGKGNEVTDGRGPIGIAAAAIYIAAILLGEHRTQKEVADVSGVTEVTIRNRYKELSGKLNINILL